MTRKLRIWERGHRVAHARSKRIGWPAWLRRRTRKLHRLIAREKAKVGPRVIVAGELVWGSPYGSLGRVRKVTVHHSAGPKDVNDTDARRLCRQYAQHHHNIYGSRGLGYHLNFTRNGSIICARPLNSKGAHVGGHNTSNVGCLFHGTTGDRPTSAQRKAWEWWLDNGHTSHMPREYRTPVAPRMLDVRGHKQWPGQSTACPGTHMSLVP